MHPYSVIIQPLVSEKSTLHREEQGKYSFLVRREASKADVKTAVEKLFEVQVASVRTLVTRGKVKRRGLHTHLSPKRKKAVVTLRAGQKLDIFDVQ